MAAWVCRGCTAVFSVGAPACPQCGSSDYCEQGEEMPKIHAHRPPTYDEGVPAPVELSPVAEQPAADEDVVADHVERPDYEALTAATLRGYLADRLLPTDGVKADLVARLQEDDARQDAEQQ